MQSPSAKGALGGAASGAVVSMLMNKKARKKLGSAAVTVGGTAAVAGLGYYAYKKWNASKGSVSSSPNQSPAQAASTVAAAPQAIEAPPSMETGLQVKIVLAMIAAAAADGAIDRNEMGHLFQQMNASQLSSEEKSHLTSTLNSPPNAEDIAALASTPEVAVELYAASLAAIDLDSPAEDFYLHSLAQALSLDEELVKQLHSDAHSL
ncbi:MAG: DUF533 domain-containing protein [Verrucomicrobiota bacterium]